MGRAGKALKQTLQTYRISQNKLAVALGVDRSIVFRWFHEQTDPSGEAIAQIVSVLQEIDPSAAKAFIRSYLGELVEEDERSSS
ncbi:MAG: helix-turn-helix transcriptional regulator [Cyanobacteriota bacterium]|nr:helix-turn-helix transcriptional regulator [Cyanobacteriota bacterium]